MVVFWRDAWTEHPVRSSSCGGGCKLRFWLLGRWPTFWRPVKWVRHRERRSRRDGRWDCGFLVPGRQKTRLEELLFSWVLPPQWVRPRPKVFDLPASSPATCLRSTAQLVLPVHSPCLLLRMGARRSGSLVYTARYWYVVPSSSIDSGFAYPGREWMSMESTTLCD